MKNPKQYKKCEEEKTSVSESRVAEISEEVQGKVQSILAKTSTVRVGM